MFLFDWGVFFLGFESTQLARQLLHQEGGGEEKNFPERLLHEPPNLDLSKGAMLDGPFFTTQRTT